MPWLRLLKSRWLKMKQTEAQLHSAVNAYLTALNPPCIWFPVPNATGNLGKRRGGMLKASGVRKAGVPDWAFMWDSGSLFIELKIEGGRQSKIQKEFERQCLVQGVGYEIARSIEDVTEILQEWELI